MAFPVGKNRRDPAFRIKGTKIVTVTKSNRKVRRF
jgi:hypothetical protein